MRSFDSVQKIARINSNGKRFVQLQLKILINFTMSKDWTFLLGRMLAIANVITSSNLIQTNTECIAHATLTISFQSRHWLIATAKENMRLCTMLVHFLIYPQLQLLFFRFGELCTCVRGRRMALIVRSVTTLSVLNERYIINFHVKCCCSVKTVVTDL